MSAILAAARIKPADLVTVDDLSDYCAAAVRLAFRGARYGTNVTDEATETLYAEVCRGIAWQNVPMYPKAKRVARSSVNGRDKVNYSKNNAQKSKDRVELAVTVLAFPKSTLPPFGVLIGKARNLRKSVDRDAAHKVTGADPFDQTLIAPDEGNRAPRVTADGAARIAREMLDQLGLLPLHKGDRPLFIMFYAAARYATLYALDVPKIGEAIAAELEMTDDAYRSALKVARERMPSVKHRHGGDVARGATIPGPTPDRPDPYALGRDPKTGQTRPVEMVNAGPLLVRPKVKHAAREGRRGGLRAAYADALLLPEGGIARKASASRTHSADLADSGWRDKAPETPVSALSAAPTPAATRPHWTTGLSAPKAARLARSANEQGRTVAPAPAPILPPAIYSPGGARTEGAPIGGTLTGTLPTLPEVAKVARLGSAPIAPKVDPVKHTRKVAKLIAEGKAKAKHHATHTPRHALTPEALAWRQTQAQLLRRANLARDHGHAIGAACAACPKGDG